MMRAAGLCLLLTGLLNSVNAHAQLAGEDKTGSWYMYFFDWQPAGRQWGIQADVQYRSWDLANDLAQGIVRGAVTYRPKSADVLFAAGYAYFTSGESILQAPSRVPY